MIMNTDEKVPLPKFLQLLASNGVPMPKAIAIAGKVFVLNTFSRPHLLTIANNPNLMQTVTRNIIPLLLLLDSMM